MSFNGKHVWLTVALIVSAEAIASVASADQAPPQIPTCDKKIGTLSVKEPEQNWWAQYNLDSPEAMIKVIVSQSKCFTLVDRGKGLAAAQSERALASGGDLRGGSNVGKGQMKAADYVLVPDVANRNRDSNGTNIGGAIAGLIPHGFGAALGGVSLKSKTADVTLALTDVRSTEQVALEAGHAKKTDLGWMGGGGGFIGAFIAGGASSYANTEIGQVIMQAYIEAYSKMVADIKQLSPFAATDNAAQAVRMAKPGRLYSQPDLKSEVVRDLDPGMMLYPTGEKMGVWWKATDELGNDGWVPSTSLELAK
jgi:curli biogenesis system outer membrane secretion channel CsgG